MSDTSINNNQNKQTKNHKKNKPTPYRELRVDNFPLKWSNETLMELFNVEGSVLGVKVFKIYNQNKCKTHAILMLRDPKVAKLTLKEFNGQYF